MNIKLIFPRKPGDPGAMGVTVPYVLPHLAAITPKEHKVELVNLFREKLDLSGRPDLVGISVMTPMAEEAYSIADECRRKGLKVVLGGHHASALPFEAKDHADAVVVGEAEETWPKLLEELSAGSLKEFYAAGPLYDAAHFSGRDVYHVPGRPSIHDLPMPRRDLLRSRYFFDSIVTTRGCPFQCKFCGTSWFYGGSVRHRPVEAVAEEVRRMGRFWLMADDDIFGDARYRLELYEKLAGMKRFMRWHGAGSLSIASDPLGSDVLRLARKSGLEAVLMGIESTEADTLKKTGANLKMRQTDGLDLKKTAEEIRRIRSYGIMVLGFFVVGFDGDSRASFDKILDFCDEACIAPIPFLFMPLPGSAMWDDYKGRLLPGVSWNKWDAVHALYEHGTMSPREREERLYRLRRSAYTSGRILKRLKGLSLGTALNALMMQAGLRKTFKADWKRLCAKDTTQS